MTTFNTQFVLDDTPFDVEFEATPLVPAKTYGPPENCHPAEGGEVDITEVTVMGQDLMPFLSDATMAKLKSMCEEAAPEMFQDEEDQAGEDAAEARAFDREWDGQ